MNHFQRRLFLYIFKKKKKKKKRKKNEQIQFHAKISLEILSERIEGIDLNIHHNRTSIEMYCLEIHKCTCTRLSIQWNSN